MKPRPINDLQLPDPREQAIRSGLLALFLRGTLFRQRVGGSLMLVFTLFCWGHSNPLGLLAWLAAGLSILMLRNRREAAYARSGEQSDPQSQERFVAGMRRIFAAHGAIWGLSLVFCFDRLPLYDQLGCWMVLACVASAPLTTVALVPQLSKAYTHSLFGALIGVLLGLSAMREAGTHGPDLLLLGLPFFYWWLLGRFGKGIHHNQREQFGLQHDISLREQEARDAVKVKNRFLASASHDMRQPVLALSLYAEHLVAFPEMHLELAPKIAAASLAVKGLFESLFDLANLDNGQVSLKVERLNIRRVIQDVHVQFEPLASARNIALRWCSVDALLDTDCVRLQRMIGNLVGNAIKYSEPGKKILLAARRHNDGVRVEVWDQGYGIPEQDIGSIFHEFYRVDRPNTASIDGVGLGLSIVCRLSRLLNTTVKVASIVGRGTRFTLDVGNVDAKRTSAEEVASPVDVQVVGAGRRVESLVLG